MTTILKTGEITITKRSTLQKLFDTRSELQRDLDRALKELRVTISYVKQHKVHAEVSSLRSKLISQDKKIQTFLRQQVR